MVWNFRTRSDPVRRLSVVTPCLLPMLLSTQGPFPPPALPGFPGTTDPSATLPARPAPRGVPVWRVRASVRASRVADLLPLPCVPAPIPRRKRIGARVARFPIRQRPSPINRRVGFRIARFEACSTFTRVPARMVAEPPKAALFTRVLQSMSLPPWPALAATNRSDSCWAGFAPARRRRLSTAHCQRKVG